MLTVAAFFWLHLVTSDVLFFRDISFTHYPRSVELRSILHAGELPLWNPFEHFGEPVAANPNYLLFYPTSWLPWLLPPAYGFKLHFILNFFLLAGGSFLLAQRAGLRPASCYLAGALFAFSGPSLSLGNFYNMLPTVAWMAPALLAADYQMRRGGWCGAAGLASVLALQLFAGEPLTSLVTAAMALAWSVTFYGDFCRPPWARANRMVLGRLLLSMALTVGLSAVQLFPALAHMQFSRRAGGLSFDLAFFWSLHPLKLLEMLVPEFFGSDLVHWRLPWLYLDGREPLFLSVFIGVVPVALALAAAVVRADRLTRFWMAVVIVGLLLALGRFTALSYLLYYVIPIFRVVRFPVKLLLPVTLGLAQLAALGLDQLLSEKARPSETRRWRLVLLVFALVWMAASAFVLTLPGPAMQIATSLAGHTFDHTFVLNHLPALQMLHGLTVERGAQWLLDVVPRSLPYVLATILLGFGILRAFGGPSEPGSSWFQHEIYRRSVAYLALGGSLLPLVVVHHKLNPLASRRFFEDSPAVLSGLRSTHPPLRIFTEPVTTIPSFAPDTLIGFPGALDFLPPSAHVPYTLRVSMQVGAGMLGVENSFTTDPEMILPESHELLNSIVFGEQLTGQALARLLALSSVEYMLVRHRIPDGIAPGFEPVGAFPNSTTIAVRAFRVGGSVPRTYLVSANNAKVLPPGVPTLKQLVSSDFDPTREVVLEQAEGGRADGVLPSPYSTGETPGEARLLRRRALRVEIEAVARVPAYLVFTDAYNPDWKVTVDGRPAALRRANQIFRAVALPPGSHRVEFFYRPRWLIYGFAMTVFSMLSLALFCWRERPAKGSKNTPRNRQSQ